MRRKCGQTRKCEQIEERVVNPEGIVLPALQLAGDGPRRIVGKKSASIIKSGRGSTTSLFKQILFLNFPSTSNPHTRQELLRQSKNSLFFGQRCVLRDTGPGTTSLSLWGRIMVSLLIAHSSADRENSADTARNPARGGGGLYERFPYTASHSDPQGKKVCLRNH